MAQKVQTFLVDDLDGGEAEGTVRFGLDGTGYEIDLSVVHSEELHKALAPYIAHARKADRVRRPARDRRNATGDETHKVREWASEQGMGIKERGRIPASIMNKYRQATGR